jgi:hypothetical protein
MSIRHTLPAVLLVLVGCTQAPAVAPVAETPVAPAAVAAAPAEAQGVTAHGKLALRGSAERTVFAAEALLKYVAADVGKVTLELFKIENAVATRVLTADLTRADGQLDDTITFSKLSYNSDYKIVATAFHKDTPFKQIDNTILGTEAATLTCTTTFSTGTSVDVTIPTDVKVQLVQYTYNGVSNPVGLDVQDGSVTDVDGDETISVSPAPVI